MSPELLDGKVFVPRMDEMHGMLGLKQIARSLRVRNIEKEEADRIFERHSAHYLNRCFRDWMK